MMILNWKETLVCIVYTNIFQCHVMFDEKTLLSLSIVPPSYVSRHSLPVPLKWVNPDNSDIKSCGEQM